MPPPLENEEDDDCIIVVEDDRPRSANNAHTESQPEARPRTSYLDALLARPPVRAIPWTPGKELPPDKAEESLRYQVRGACILATRGAVIEPKCTGCALDTSRFSLCIALPDWFQGSCAGCTMKAKPAQCSLRATHDAANTKSPETEAHTPLNDEIEADSQHVDRRSNRDQAVQLNGHNLESERYNESFGYDASMPNPDAPNTAAYQAFWRRPDGITEFEKRGDTYYIYGGEVYCRISIGRGPDGKTLLCNDVARFANKRGLMSHIKNLHREEWDKIQEMGMNKAGKKSYVERDAAEKHFANQLLLIKPAAQKGSTGIATGAQQPLPATEPSRKRKRQSEEVDREHRSYDDSTEGGESSALLDYVKEKEKRNSRRLFNLLSNAISYAQEASEPGTYEFEGPKRLNIGWQNRATHEVPGQPVLSCHICNDGKIFSRRDNLSRHLRLAHPTNNQELQQEVSEDLNGQNEEPEVEQPLRWEILRTEGPSSSRDWPNPVHEPLIDTLPKSKQRQIYGIVSGLQGGIDHLQKELDNLKRVLGIDDEN